MLSANLDSGKSKASWYVVQVRGKLNTITDSIHNKIKEMGYPEDTVNILTLVKEGKRVAYGKVIKTETSLITGYLFIQMVMTDALEHMILSTPNVTKFIGEASQEEIDRLLSGSADRANNVVLIKFDIGEEVKIISGPFASFTGVIQEVEEDRQKLKLAVSIFGRPTPVELEYSQVEKI